MAVVTLIPKLHSLGTTFDFGIGPVTVADLSAGGTKVGDTDYGGCCQASSDGKYIHLPDTDSLTLYWEWDDDGSIPLTATIQSVQLAVRHEGTTIGGTGPFNVNGTLAGGTINVGFQRYSDLNPPTANVFFIDVPASVDYDVVPGQVWAYTTAVSGVETTNPATSSPWARAELFCGSAGEGIWNTNPVTNNSVGDDQYNLDSLALIVTYTGGGNPEDGLRYDLDVEEPPIRKFDGITDKFIAKIPKSLV